MDTESNDFMSSFDLASYVSTNPGDDGQAQNTRVDGQGQLTDVHGQATDDGTDCQQQQEIHRQQQHQDIQRDVFGNNANVKRSVGMGGNSAEQHGSSQVHMRSPSRSMRQGGILQQGMDDSSNAMLAALSMNSTMSPSQLSMEAIQAFLSMQAPNMLATPSLDGHAQQQHQLPPPQPSSILGTNTASSPSTQALLEQQLRLAQLQQLQQLQNQIFQQQIELISGQTGLTPTSSANIIDQSHQFRDHASFHGLPTPVSSTELRAQDSSNFVSPMTLQNYMGTTQLPLPHFSTATAQQNTLPQGTSSAPAHLAFQNSQPLPSPGDPEYDFSPIASPWLEAYQQQSSTDLQQQLQRHRHSNDSQIQGTKKRGASSSSGEDGPSQTHTRKKQSPAIRPIRSTGTASKRASAHRRGTASLTSTPAILAMPNMKTPSSVPPNNAFTISEVVGDTPSPVDLSMPPPAPPTSSPDSQNLGSEQGNESNPVQTVGSNSVAGTPSLAPVTPASIMNLGRLGISSGPSSSNAASNVGASTSSTTAVTRKSPPKAKASGSTAKPLRKAGTTSQSPALKPLLPGGIPASSAAHLAAQSNYSHHLSGSASSLNISPTTPLPQPTLQVRKTSHKAAEQKRRDSLKTSFDDLRLLLPPIPLPNDEGYDGEPPLPGAMPPRGPPRGEAAGPNRAVSKLQLLRCGNQFIRVLKGRITRRDEHIEKLRNEIKALRSHVDEDILKGMESLDLDEDLDAEEANLPVLRVGAGGMATVQESAQEGDDADEDE